MILLVRDWLLFATVILGGGAALAPDRRNFDALESWCVGIAAAVAILAGAVFVTFAAGLPPAGISAGFLALAAVAWVRRSRLVALARDQSVRDTFAAWLLVSGGALALATCIFSYSGGLWMGDWEEHYQRPLQLLGVKITPEILRHLCPVYFTSRPPLANLAESAFLWLTGPAFARHQVMLLLLNSLAFLPAAAFARTFGGGRAAAPAAACLFLLNPAFLQNATYAWTKLIVAFFVLLGLHVLFTREQDRSRTILGFALLTLGVLTHYSACVWLLVFGGVWLVAARAQWRLPAFCRTVALSAAVFAAVLAPWLAYAVARYGLTATLASNTSATTAAQFTWWENLASTVPKLWATLVPHTFRSFDHSLLAQTNPWTLFRDQVFYVYQSNLFFAAGTPTLLAMLWPLLRRTAPPLPRVWLIALPIVIVLGTAVHGHIDYWGLAHICLQPLVLLGLAVAAARLPDLLRGPAARVLAALLALAAVADSVLGIALRYAGTALQLNRAPGENILAYAKSLNVVAQHNLWQKVRLGQDWVADAFPLPWWHALAVFAALTVFLALRAHRLARVSHPA
jgi:hypothetical protein